METRLTEWQTACDKQVRGGDFAKPRHTTLPFNGMLTLYLNRHYGFKSQLL